MLNANHALLDIAITLSIVGYVINPQLPVNLGICLEMISVSHA